MLNESELEAALLEAAGRAETDPDFMKRSPGLQRILRMGGKPTAEELFVPDQRLLNRLSDYDLWCDAKRREVAGDLMEEIAYLAFRGLTCRPRLRSFQSYSSQLDLLVDSDGDDWQALLTYLGLSEECRSFVVEAKNLKGRVEDKQFMRLCGLMTFQFSDQAYLGVFFSRKGATGFPVRGKRRSRLLRDAQASQIIYHAHTGKYVIVLDDIDIRSLAQKGSLPAIMRERIRDIEAWSGLTTMPDNESVDECNLPMHLRQYVEKADVVGVHLRFV